MFSMPSFTGVGLYGLRPLTILQATRRPEAAVQRKRKREGEADEAAEARAAAAAQKQQERGHQYSGVRVRKKSRKLSATSPPGASSSPATKEEEKQQDEKEGGKAKEKQKRRRSRRVRRRAQAGAAAAAAGAVAGPNPKRGRAVEEDSDAEDSDEDGRGSEVDGEEDGEEIELSDDEAEVPGRLAKTPLTTYDAPTSIGGTSDRKGARGCVMLNNMIVPQGLFMGSASSLAQLSVLLGVPGIVKEKASALEDKMGKSGRSGGHQKKEEKLALIYGDPDSVLRNQWGARVAYPGGYAAGILNNIRKKDNGGLLFFTPLFLLVLTNWAEGEQWLNQLKDYRNNFSAMDTAIADIFSDRFIKILKKDEWIFSGNAAAFVQRLHAAMEKHGIGRPPDGKHRYSDFIPGAVVAYVEALLDRSVPVEHLSKEDERAKGKFLYKCYRKALVPKGQEYAKKWSIPCPHELMVGEGKLLHMWADVFEKVPFEFAKE